MVLLVFIQGLETDNKVFQKTCQDISLEFGSNKHAYAKVFVQLTSRIL